MASQRLIFLHTWKRGGGGGGADLGRLPASKNFAFIILTIHMPMVLRVFPSQKDLFSKEIYMFYRYNNVVTRNVSRVNVCPRLVP